MSWGRGRIVAAFALLCVLSLLASAWWIVESDGRTRLLARNALLLAAGTCVVSLPPGALLALLAARTNMPGRRAAGLTLGAMLFVPLYVQAAAWDAGFGPLGWCSIALDAVNSPLLAGWRAAIWVHAAASIPWVALIVASGLRFVDSDLEEQALLDGSAGQVLWRVTLRSAAPSLAAAALWILVTTAGEMTVTDLYRVRTYCEELYTGFALGEDLAYAWRTALPGGLMVVWLAAGVFFAVAAFARASELASWRTHWTFRLGRVWRRLSAILALGLLLLIAVVPLGNLCYQAGVVVEQVGGRRVRFWSPVQLAQVVGGCARLFQEEFKWSLLIAGVCASAAVLLAAPLAWRARRGGVRAGPALAVTAFCLATPGPLIGMAVAWLFSACDCRVLSWLYNRTILPPVVALLVRASPLAILICWHGLRSLSSDVLDSAEADGAGPLTRFWRVAAPQRCLSFAAAWLAALAVAMGDLAASIITTPPGVTTVSIRVFGLMHAGVRSQEAGVCLISTAGFVVVAAGVMRLLGWRRIVPASDPRNRPALRGSSR